MSRYHLGTLGRKCQVEIAVGMTAAGQTLIGFQFDQWLRVVDDATAINLGLAGTTKAVTTLREDTNLLLLECR